MKARKLTKTERIRRELIAHPDMNNTDLAKKLGVKYQAVWDTRKKMAAKAIADMKKDGLRRNPRGKILMQRSSPVVGKGNEFEQIEGKWQAVEDNVNHPAHYKVGGIETIDFIEAKDLNYRLGNVVKYISRASHKGDRLENLKKARWYLDREINQIS